MTDSNVKSIAKIATAKLDEKLAELQAGRKTFETQALRVIEFETCLKEKEVKLQNLKRAYQKEQTQFIQIHNEKLEAERKQCKMILEEQTKKTKEMQDQFNVILQKQTDQDRIAKEVAEKARTQELQNFSRQLSTEIMKYADEVEVAKKKYMQAIKEASRKVQLSSKEVRDTRREKFELEKMLKSTTFDLNHLQKKFDAQQVLLEQTKIEVQEYKQKLVLTNNDSAKEREYFDEKLQENQTVIHQLKESMRKIEKEIISDRMSTQKTIKSQRSNNGQLLQKQYDDLKEKCVVFQQIINKLQATHEQKPSERETKQFQELTHQLQEKENQLVSLNAKLEENYVTIRQCKESMGQMEKQIIVERMQAKEKHDSKITRAQNIVSTTIAEIMPLADENEMLKRSINQLVLDIQTEVNQSNALKQTKQKLDDQVQTLETILTDKQTEINILQQCLGSEKKIQQELLNNHREVSKQKNQEIRALKEEITDLTLDLEETKASLASTKSKIQTKNNRWFSPQTAFKKKSIAKKNKKMKRKNVLKQLNFTNKPTCSKNFTQE